MAGEYLVGGTVMIPQAELLEIQHKIHSQQQRIAELEKAVPRWISVEDSLPETGFLPFTTLSLCVLAWSNQCQDSEDAFIAVYGDDGKWRTEEPMDAGEIVTHWMPLPAPPTEGK
jgi:hypothetical protein